MLRGWSHQRGRPCGCREDGEEIYLGAQEGKEEEEENCNMKE